MITAHQPHQAKTKYARFALWWCSQSANLLSVHLFQSSTSIICGNRPHARRSADDTMGTHRIPPSTSSALETSSIWHRYPNVNLTHTRKSQTTTTSHGYNDVCVLNGSVRPAKVSPFQVALPNSRHVRCKIILWKLVPMLEPE
jgi:hypothetical protein